MKVPLGEENEIAKRRNLFNWDIKQLGPLPTWDNEWRQEADKTTNAPTMTGIMAGAYYMRNSHNPSCRIPRQEWDMQVRTTGMRVWYF